VKRKAYSRERRERLKAAGLCVDCGGEKAAKGKTRCKKCEMKMKESRQKWEILHAMDMEAEEARKRNG
jgi:tRNA(Ile2) C34 agmatinyltransferase TiaS